MRINGKPVKSARLFLGNEYTIQVKKLSDYFKVSEDYHKSIKFDYDTYLEILKNMKPIFRWEGIINETIPKETKITYDNFVHAYHHLMIELVLLQVKSIKVATGDDNIEKLYIEGGFSDNDVYIKLLTHYLRNMEFHAQYLGLYRASTVIS